MSYCYDYPRPGVTVDCVVFGLDAAAQLKVLLIQRKYDPFGGQWALPGGFVQMDEPLETAALRELGEETGVCDLFLEQLYTFGHPERDPRDRIISVAYYALVNLCNYTLQAQTDASEAEWFAIAKLPTLAFDHATIIDIALKRLRGKIRYEPIGFELLPEKFTLTQLQRLYEVILGMDLDKRNFRKKILKMDLLIPLNEKEQGVAHRAAQLYRFDTEKYRMLAQHGFNFEV